MTIRNEAEARGFDHLFILIEDPKCQKPTLKEMSFEAYGYLKALKGPEVKEKDRLINDLKEDIRKEKQLYLENEREWQKVMAELHAMEDSRQLLFRKQIQEKERLIKYLQEQIRVHEEAHGRHTDAINRSVEMKIEIANLRKTISEQKAMMEKMAACVDFYAYAYEDDDGEQAKETLSEYTAWKEKNK